jgi:hypothetical protein
MGRPLRLSVPALPAPPQASGSSGPTALGLGLLLPNKVDPGNVHFLGVAGLEFSLELVVRNFRGEAVGKSFLFHGPGDRLIRAVEGKKLYAN